VEKAGRQATVVVSHFGEETLAAVHALKPANLQVDGMSLEDIFVAMVGHTEEA
jgi:hypothetical protein